MNAAALVVGIDEYESLPGLSGCTTDALEAVDWLMSIGVEPKRIRLHLATSRAVSIPEGVIRLTAERDAIWKSIVGLRQETGERLFVFLSGHGYFILESGPIFLAQDWSSDNSNKNMDVWAFARHFQGLKFRDTLFVVDACQNQDTADIYRSTVDVAGPGKKITPKPQNGVLLCCAAAQGQYAPVVDGRGLLTRKLLQVLREAPDAIPPNAREAFVYDWRTGSARLNLLPLFRFVVAPWVTKAAQPHIQTPTATPYGRLANEWGLMVRDLEIEVTPLKITATPLDGVDTITLQLRPATMDHQLPTQEAPLPFTGVAPTGRRLIAYCLPASGWEADDRTRDIASVSKALDLRFTLNQPPAPPPPDQDAFNLRVIDDDGNSVGELLDADYKAVGVDPEAAFKTAFPAGSPGVEHHETGPDVFLNGSEFDVARAAAVRLRNRLSDQLLSRGIRRQITITPPGLDPRTSQPNVKLTLPDGGPAGFVGYLGEEPLIRIERPGQEGEPPVKSLTANRVADLPWLRLDPGSYRATVDAPWGRSSVMIDVEPTGSQVVELPRPVGQPPLRNRLVGSPLHDLTIADGRDGASWMSIDTAFQADHLAAPTLPGLSLLIDRRDGLLRVEPYSDLPWREWDQLIGAGRLDAVDLDASLARLAGAREGVDVEVLRLALGYAAWAQQRRELIGAFIDPLSPTFRYATDAVLLRLEAANEVTFTPLAPPLLRWGVQLMHRAPETEIAAWPSPTSVWSVYEGMVVETEPEPEPFAYRTLEAG